MKDKLKVRTVNSFEKLAWIVITAVAILSVAAAVYIKNKVTRFSELDTDVNKVVNIVGYMSPIMKEDFTFLYMQSKPYDYEVSDKTIGVYLDESYGYYSGLVEVRGKLKKANENDYDILKVSIDGEEGYIEKDKLTEEKKQLIKDNNVECEYLYTDGSTNTFKFKIDGAEIDTYNGNKYKEEDTILNKGYTDLVNGLLEEVRVRVQGEESEVETSENEADAGEHEHEDIIEENEEHGINTANASVLAEYIRTKTKYKELAGILNETINIYNESKRENLDSEMKNTIDKEAEELYNKFITELSLLAVD